MVLDIYTHDRGSCKFVNLVGNNSNALSPCPPPDAAGITTASSSSPAAMLAPLRIGPSPRGPAEDIGPGDVVWFAPGENRHAAAPRDGPKRTQSLTAGLAFPTN